MMTRQGRLPVDNSGRGLIGCRAISNALAPAPQNRIVILMIRRRVLENLITFPELRYNAVSG